MTRLSLRQTILMSGVAFLLTLTSIILIGPEKASATHGTIPASVAPQWVRDTIADKCHNAGWNIVQLQWISPQGSPGATSMTVVSGSASAPLQLNWITYRCRSSTHLQGSSQIVSTSPSISALNGLITDFPYPGSVNTYRTGVSRTFNYPGPFTSSRDITLNLTTRGTVTYTSGADYCAVVNTEPRVSTTQPHNFTPQPGYCFTSTNPFTIRINVAADTGTCSIVLSTSTPAPSGTFTATFTVRNTGSYATWPVGGRPPVATPNTNRYQLGSGHVASDYDNNRWTQVPNPTVIAPDTAPRHNRIELPAAVSDPFYGPLIFAGQTVVFTVTIRAPAANGVYNFGWRLLQRGVKNFTNTGSHCNRVVTVGTPFAVSCRSITPRSVEVGEPFAITLEFDNDSAAGGPTVSTANYRMTVNQSGPPGYNNNDLPFTSAPPGGSGSGRAPPAGDISITSPGTYEVTMVLYDRRGTASTADDTEVLRCDQDDDYTINAATHPYFIVRGGDMATGMSGSCDGWAVGAATDLKAWNAAQTGGDPNQGAGTNLAVFALSVIEGFASAQGLMAPTGLTYANDPVLSGFGGNYPAGNDCPANYFAGRQGAGVLPANQVPNNSNSYNLTGPLPINAFGPTTTTAGNRPTVYVNGNVRILNNIVLAHGATVDTLAGFRLIVQGNIFIHPRVTQLHGLFVAQPNGAGVGGNIYTCSDGSFGAPSVAALNSTDATTGCQRQLNVFGAMIARELKLYRSNGSVRQNIPAEIFTLTPQLWLGEPGSSGVEFDGDYDAITGLPPVL